MIRNDPQILAFNQFDVPAAHWSIPYDTLLSTSCRSSDPVLTKIEWIEQGLEVLKNDLDEDISGEPVERFNERVARQFQLYEKIVDLRSSMKGEQNLDEVLYRRKAQYTHEYKKISSEIPAFRLAAEIKALLSRREVNKNILWSRLSYLLWSEDITQGNLNLLQLRVAYKHDGQVDPSMRVEWKTAWRKVQKVLLEGYQRARPLLSHPNYRQLTWVTGTSTATLVPMVRMQVPELDGPALIPTVILLNHGFVPLTGKLDGIGAGGANQMMVSGCRFPEISAAKEYAENAKPYGSFTVASELNSAKWYLENKGKIESPVFELDFARMEVAFLRLLFLRAQGTPGAKEALMSLKTFIQERINRIPQTAHQLEKFGSLICAEVFEGGEEFESESVAEGMIVSRKEEGEKATYAVVRGYYKYRSGIKCLITGCEQLRWVFGDQLKMYTDEELAKATDKMQAGAGKKRKTLTFPFIPEKAILNDFLRSIDGEDKYKKMDEDDAFLVQHPSELLFGSWTLKPDTDLKTFSTPISAELGAVGPQKLGKDIQVAFVEDAAVERVKKYLKTLPESSKIYVLSMRALLYLTAAYKDRRTSIYKDRTTSSYSESRSFSLWENASF